MRRTKRIAAAALLIAGMGVGFFAGGGTGTVLAGHKQGPACHGENQTPCRPDPQPEHGNDCGTNSTYPLNSNDHCGEETPL